MKISNSGLELLKSLEGYVPKAYPDGHGYSIGYGHFLKPEDYATWAKGDVKNLVISKEKGEELLRFDLDWAEKAVLKNISAPINQNQFDALVSLAYNIGPGGFAASPITRAINMYYLPEEVAEVWEKSHLTSKGQYFPPLAKRREKEAAHFLKQPVSVVPVASIQTAPLVTQDENKGFPWLWLGVGVGGLVLVSVGIAVAVSVSKSKNGK